MLEYQQHVEMSMCWWMQLSKDGSKDGMEEMEYAYCNTTSNETTAIVTLSVSGTPRSFPTNSAGGSSNHGAGSRLNHSARIGLGFGLSSLIVSLIMGLLKWLKWLFPHPCDRKRRSSANQLPIMASSQRLSRPPPPHNVSPIPRQQRRADPPPQRVHQPVLP